VLRLGVHVPEAEKALPLLGDDPLQAILALAALLGPVLEEHAYPVATGGRELYASGFSLAAEEGVGDLGQDTRPIPRLGVATAGPPVLQVPEHLEPLLDRLARAPPVYARNEPQPTGLVLVAGVVKAGSGGQRAASCSATGCGSPILAQTPRT
jgi:hypothetical protein